MDGTAPQMAVHRFAAVPVANDTRDKVVPFVTKPQIAIRCGHIGLDKCRGPFLRQSRKAPVSGRYSRQPTGLSGTKVKNAAARAVAEYRLGGRHNVTTGSHHRKMRYRAGEKTDLVIGDADSLGTMHDLKLRLVEPGHVQHHVGAEGREGRA